jgi:signal transduction histidine kinase/CheY-like chemotaxis protein
MIVPLTGGGRCAGALLLGASTAAPDRGQLAFGRAIGAYVGQALVLARTFAQERAARAAAEEASRAKDEFLAMLGHELRNPLAPIVTALHLLRLRAGPGWGHEHDVMERQVKHLAHLVNDLLDVSRIACGKVELKRERIELAAVVDDAVEMVRPLLDQRAHHLSIAIAPEGLTVDADPERLSQVVSNLLTNAAKYTEKGGHIAISAGLDGDDVVLRVRDSGIGIGPEMLARIFDRFTQERQALDRSQGGLGLGLSIVHSLVTLHGGSVHADSEGVGRGAELTVRLPVAAPLSRAGSLAPETPKAARTGAAASVRILLVDDNQDAAEMLADLLESFGFATRVAHDGPAALLLAGEVQPHVALLDLGLPGMDGYELGRRLRQLPGLERLPLVAITGYGQDSDKQRSRDAGFDVHLVKPIDLRRVRAVVTGLTERLHSAER